MRLLIMILSWWGILDSLFLLASPLNWRRFWQSGIEQISHGRLRPTVTASVQLTMCMWMVYKASKERR